MRKLFIGLGIVVALLIAAAIMVPFMIPANVYIARVAAVVKQATGRDLKIAGPVSFHLLPNLALTADSVSLSNSPGTADTDFVTIGKLDVGLKLLPLLSKRIEISHLTLNQPVIHLETDRQGNANWSFKPASATPEAAPGGDGKAQAQMQQLELGTIKIVDGAVSYLDARSGKKQAADNVNVTLSLPSMADKLTLTASAQWNGKTATVDLSAAKAASLLDGSGTALTLKLDAPSLSLALDGEGKGKGGKAFGFTGKIDLSSPSVRALAAWTGTPLKISGSGLGPLSLKGKIAIAGASLALSEAELSLDAIKASGTLSVDANGPKPVVKGNLDLGGLDLNPYIAAAHGESATSAPAAPATPGSGWSTAPIDASALKAADADLALSVTALKFHTIDLGKTAFDLKLGNGRLAIVFKQLSLYGGGGKGRIALDGANTGVGFDASFALGGVQMQPLLQAAIGVDRFTGTGNVDIDLTGHGHNQAEIMQGLGGKGSLKIANGAVKGVDLVAIEHKPLEGLRENKATAETAFTALSGSFTASGGVLNNPDLVLASPAIGVTGKGSIDLFHRTLNYRIEPNLPAGIQGGKSGIYGTTVPILIDGPWTALNYRPDVQAVLQQKASKAVNQEVGKLLGKNGGQANGLLKGLLGR